MNKRKKPGIGVLVVIGLFVYFAFVLVDQHKVMQAKVIENESIEKKIQEELRINETLKKQKETINTQEYTEKVAREKLGWVKRGERVFVDINK